MPTVLIVEDNHTVAKFYALALERAGGMRCFQGRSGDEVIASARAGGIDLILLDVSLAGFTYEGRTVDGLEIARLLKADPQTRSIPILLATAHAMQGDRERFLVASSADDYIQKPVYDPQVLVAKVREVIAAGAGGSSARAGGSEA